MLIKGFYFNEKKKKKLQNLCLIAQRPQCMHQVYSMLVYFVHLNPASSFRHIKLINGRIRVTVGAHQAFVMPCHFLLIQNDLKGNYVTM